MNFDDVLYRLHMKERPTDLTARAEVVLAKLHDMANQLTVLNTEIETEQSENDRLVGALLDRNQTLNNVKARNTRVAGRITEFTA